MATTGDFALAIDIQQGQNSEAYSMLCREIQSRVTPAQFSDTRGAAVSPMLATTQWMGTGVEEVPDEKTLDASVVDTWGVYEAMGSSSASSGKATSRAARWRINFSREAGAWKVCGFVPA